MPDFPHLKLPFKVEGTIKPSNRRPRTQTSQITVANKANRQQHGEYLEGAASTIIQNWEDIKAAKQQDGIELPNPNDVPVFLKVDTSSFKVDSLTNWGIEVISEEENGYIIGASVDNLESFQANVEQFLNEEGRYRDTAAKIWELVTDGSWRVAQLLKGDLLKIWDNLNVDTIYNIECAVSCYVPNTKIYPSRTQFDSEDRFNEKVEEYNAHERALQIERGDKQLQRESEIEKYVEIHHGTLHDIWDNDIDAIFFKMSIRGEGLRDLVLTYQYLFEVKLSADYSVENTASPLVDDYAPELTAPNPNAPKVCVIDSGIQEDHRLITAAIDQGNSKSYVDGDASTSDYVRISGHGTKVAGAVLYPDGVPKHGPYTFHAIIQNARILDNNNRISDNRFIPALLEQIVRDFPETRIFNLSVCENSSYNGTHMPALAACIDKLMHERDILFIVAAGNLFESSATDENPGITEHFAGGQSYPGYLDLKTSKISSPGVSYFAITVGSICLEDFEDDDYKCLAGKMKVSPFSRTGLGLWGNIKPDVVAFGGDLAKNKNANNFKVEPTLCPELINSTRFGASAVGKSSYGTSFSAPKVTYIVARLQEEHPTETAQMYRALTVQSARLPAHCFDNPSAADFRNYGYGIPDVNRALNNTANRITFIQSGSVGYKKADIYRLNIPAELRGEGRNFSLLVEVTLAFTAKTRLTRKGSHSYLSHWLEWQSSRYNEGFTSFRNKTIEYLELDEDEMAAGQVDQGLDAIHWVLRENPAWTSNEVNRNNSTVQKSWAVIQPHQFAEEFSLAVIGHAGWDKNPSNSIPYSLCVSFESVGGEVNVYNLLSEAQVETELEQEVEV